MSTQTEVTDNRPFYWVVPVVFLAAVVAFFRLAYPLLNDDDVPWHLATGKLIFHTSHLPANDPFAYGNQDQPWVNLSWFWDYMLGAVQSMFGVLGAYIFTISIGAGLTAGVTYRLLKMNIAFPAVLLTTMLVGLCMIDYMTARPQLVGYTLAFLFHAVLHKSRGDTGYRHLWWLAPLMVLWTNSHGSFMAGFIIMGAYCVEAWFTGRHDWLKRIIIMGVICAVCALVNPYGPKVVLGTLLSLNGSSTKYNMEWQPFSFGRSTGLSLWLVIVIAASNLKGAKVAIADKVMAMGWFIATMFAIRNGAFFILTAAPYLATCLDEQTRDLRKPQPETPLMKFMKAQPLKNVWIGAVAAFAVLCVVARVIPHDDQIGSEDFSIKDVVDYATKNYPDHHFYTDYNMGGQVIYLTDGKLPFFMDSRAGTAYSDPDIKDYINFMKLGEGWQSTLTKRHMNGIIAGKNLAFATSYANGLYHDHWKLVFEGKRANVYIATQETHFFSK